MKESSSVYYRVVSANVALPDDSTSESEREEIWDNSDAPSLGDLGMYELLGVLGEASFNHTMFLVLFFTGVERDISAVFVWPDTNFRG
jgi:hypothetical protein